MFILQFQSKLVPPEEIENQVITKGVHELLQKPAKSTEFEAVIQEYFDQEQDIFSSALYDIDINKVILL